MKKELFSQIMDGFVEATKYRSGKRAKVRVTKMAFEPVDLRPQEIRTIRTKLHLSQPQFADFLGTSVGSVRSWEQGSRKPQASALRLLVIAKKKPALLLEDA